MEGESAGTKVGQVRSPSHGWSWSQAQALIEKLDKGLESAIREHEVDSGTGFFHEFEIGNSAVLVALEDWKYKVRHKGIEVEESFIPPLFSDSWTRLWNSARTSYSDKQFEERLVRDLIELVKAALPADACLRASAWIVAAWQDIEISIDSVGYDAFLATYRIDGKVGKYALQAEIERSFEAKMPAQALLQRLSREIRKALENGSR